MNDGQGVASLIPPYRLSEGPNPLPFARVQDPEGVPEVRKTNCRNYNRCLSLADSRKWEGFHCNDCSSYSPYHPASDYDGCAAIVTELAKIAPFDMEEGDVLKALGLCRKSDI